MIDYAQFFQDHRAESFDEVDYFAYKSQLILKILEFYTEGYNRLLESGAAAQVYLTPYDQKLKAHNRLDDAVLLDLFSRFLDPAYVVPVEDFNEMQVHLLALYNLFACVHPGELSHEQMMRLDITCLRLTATAMHAIAAVPSMLSNAVHAGTMIDGKTEEKAENIEAVSMAFEQSGAQWIKEARKKTILYKGKEYTPHGFAGILERRDKKTGLLPGQRTIKKHLDALFEKL
jgi:hypothetical protein